DCIKGCDGSAGATVCGRPRAATRQRCDASAEVHGMHAFLRNRCPFGALALAPPDPERRSRTNHSLSLDDPDHAATRPPQDALSAWNPTVRPGSPVEPERHDTPDAPLHPPPAPVTAPRPT